MAEVSAQTELLRAGRYRFTGKLNYIPKTLILSCSVNMTSVPNPLLAITYDNAYGGSDTFWDGATSKTVTALNGRIDVYVRDGKWRVVPHG